MAKIVFLLFAFTGCMIPEIKYEEPKKEPKFKEGQCFIDKSVNDLVFKVIKVNKRTYTRCAISTAGPTKGTKYKCMETWLSHEVYDRDSYLVPCCDFKK